MAVTINASTSAGLVQTADTSGVLQLQTNSGTTALTIDTSQNVGIGTASPAAKLNVATGSGTLTQNIVTIKGGGATGSFSGLSVQSNSGDEIFNVNNLSYNVTMGTVAGNLLVGTTSQITTGGFSPKLSITNAGNAAFFTTSTNASIMGMQINTNGGDGIKFYNASASNVGNITINSGGTAYGTTSDYRLKENIAPMTGALEKVSLLKPVIYTWKTDDSNGQGFIAHELQAIIPDAVVGEKDAVNEDGSIKPQCIDTSFLVATLTAAIKEQQTIINDLKARVTALEAK
jgi:hypothetical protein